ncbi:MAG: molybdopterin-dependent oxidoreductase [Lachnospiraceae bacterium]|nr:molybdopterin-dependent oxidoreductase [Lachnospiraceae bacterium]
MKTYWKRSACPYDCPDECGLLIKTDGKQILEVKGDPEHPVTKGFICRKMNHYEKTVHHPGRILTPLKRVGAKGSGDFVPTTWERAVKEITEHWKQIIQDYGAEVILPYSYGGNEHAIQNKSGEAFFYALGASNLERTICAKAKGEGYAQILGNTQGRNPSIMEQSDLIFIWGCNIAVTYLHAYQNIVCAKKKGAKIILIETYESPAATVADEVVLVKPGTDSALALSMAYVMKQQGLLNNKYLEQYTHGWEEFTESIDAYPPHKMASICGVDETTIKHLAKLLGTAKHPSIILGSGLSRHANGAMTVRCIITLQALTGALGDAKGGIIGELSTGYALDRTLISRPDFQKKKTRTINMNQLGDALNNMESPIHSLYVYNVNPANTAPNQSKVLQGLLRDDLFTIVHERFMTDTAKYADIILPADTSVEHSDITTPYGHLFLQRTYPIIPPPGEAKSNWDTFCLLAKAMGFEDSFWQLSNDKLADYVVEHSKTLRSLWTSKEYEQFQQGYGVLLPIDDPHHYQTPSGKVELINETLGTDRIPHYKENYGGRYPLRLVTAPHVQTLNSTFTERKELLKRRGDMTLMIHPEDALDRNITDGCLIKAYNDHAVVIFRAHVTSKVKKGTAIAEGVFQQKQSYNGYTVNALLSQKLTDYGAAASLNDNTIEIAVYKQEA